LSIAALQRLQHFAAFAVSKAAKRCHVHLQDEAYTRVSELKSLQKAKNDEFYANRRFSRTVREVGKSRPGPCLTSHLCQLACSACAQVASCMGPCVSARARSQVPPCRQPGAWAPQCIHLRVAGVVWGWRRGSGGRSSASIQVFNSQQFPSVGPE
jgi:hypothetical protein